MNLTSDSQCIKMNDLFAEYIRTSNTFELVTPPSFALTVFRLVPPATASAAWTPDELNSLNRCFHNALQEHHDQLLLTQTELVGVFCMRFAVGAARTNEGDIRRAWEVIKKTGEDVLKQSTEDRNHVAE